MGWGHFCLLGSRPALHPLPARETLWTRREFHARIRAFSVRASGLLSSWEFRVSFRRRGDRGQVCRRKTSDSSWLEVDLLGRAWLSSTPSPTAVFHRLVGDSGSASRPRAVASRDGFDRTVSGRLLIRVDRFPASLVGSRDAKPVTRSFLGEFRANIGLVRFHTGGWRQRMNRAVNWSRWMLYFPLI